MSLDSPHEFVLIYRDPSQVGAYADVNSGRVREVAVSAPSALLWDQVSVPRLAKREGVDLLFNPKYSVPLATQSRTVFVCHGLDWYVMPEWSRWSDRMSHRYLIPRYARKADRIIAVSKTARQHVIEFLGVPEDRVDTVYLGLGDAFRRPVERARLEELKGAYGLPDHFVLYCGQIYPPKNFGRLIEAYASVGPRLGVSLVVAGKHTWLCKDECALIDRLGISDWVIRTGWVDHEKLPAFYRSADALLLPSLYEACPSPPLEAMASGCPVLTANRYGAKEIAGGAALLVDPEDSESIAAGIARVLTDQELRGQLVKAGHERARNFSWRKCAEETHAVLEKVLKD